MCVCVCVAAAQSYSMNAAAAARPAEDPGVDVEYPAAAAGGELHGPAPALICRWASKRISAVDGSQLVLARYSQKSSTASQDDDAAAAAGSYTQGDGDAISFRIHARWLPPPSCG